MTAFIFTVIISRYPGSRFLFWIMWNLNYNMMVH
ncbi:hypothetical protein PGS1_09760 [Enterobacter cloacae subsp. cloacae GS1]|nr:hypothetical protein PGS1_09760 [Enterobacter cloacae subsp. cloacae GS1]